MHAQATVATDGRVRDVPPRFSDPALASTPESAQLALALAVKLGCRRICLLGAVREPIVRALGPDVELVGFDRESVIAHARELGVAGSWLPLPKAGTFPGDAAKLVEGALLLTDAGMFLAHARALNALIAAATAAVVVDPDGGLGIDSVAAIVRVAEEASLAVEHRSLIRSPIRREVRRESPYVVVSSGADERVAPTLSCGPRSLALDPDVDPWGATSPGARICIASYEVSGPTRNGGIGTANTSLALSLAEAGHEVSLLHTGYPGPDGPVDEPAWRRRFARRGVEFNVLRVGFESRARAPHANVRRAYELYQWLRQRDRQQPFDIVHFPECQGHGYYAVLARRQGLAFTRTMFVAGVHSSTRWCSEANRELPRSIDGLVDEHLERVSIELADVLISPSAYMLDYLEERGWKLPQRRFVQQYILPRTERLRRGVRPKPRRGPIEEIVFFGRLEVRKGIERFCDALDLIAQQADVDDLEITFLGRPEHVHGEPAVEYIARRAARWPWPHRVLGTLDRNQAMAHMRRHRCLAVMPSTVDNLPNAVIEGLSLGIPLIASRGGGTGELFDPLDLSAVSVPGLERDHGVPPVPAEMVVPAMSADVLAARITESLRTPTLPRFAIDHDLNERIHVGWNAAVAARTRAGAADQAPSLASPLTVSVAIVSLSPDAALLRTLTALEEQREQLTDVTVRCLRGGDQRGLGAADALCRRHGWRLEVRDDSTAEALRHELLEHCAGELLVLMRPTESLAPGGLQTLRDVAARTVADILTWPTVDPEGHYGDAADILTWPTVDPEGHYGGAADDADRAPVLVPIAGPPLAGLHYLAFTSGPYAITRKAFERLRGFADDAGVLDADHELLNRALLHGCSMVVIPEPLSIATAADPSAAVRGAATVELGDYNFDRSQALRIARPFASIAPAQLADLPGLYLTQHAKTTEERLRALVAYKQLDDLRHSQAEYIAYLEAEHHRLSDMIHGLEATVARSPSRRVRRTLDRLRRRLRGGGV